jgi:hypothetical protein
MLSDGSFEDLKYFNLSFFQGRQNNWIGTFWGRFFAWPSNPWGSQSFCLTGSRFPITWLDANENFASISPTDFKVASAFDQISQLGLTVAAGVKIRRKDREAFSNATQRYPRAPPTKESTIL